MNYRASRTTRVTLDQDRVIASGDTITVFGIIVANSANQPAEVDIQDASGNNKITITVPAQDSRESKIEWIADGGVLIDSIGDSNVIVTVFHSQPGS